MQKGVITIVICALAGLILAYSSAKFGPPMKVSKPVGASSASSGSIVAVTDPDEESRKLLEFTRHDEARYYLSDNPERKTTVFGWKKDKILQIVKDAYSAGAEKVKFVKIDFVNDVETTSTLVVELPARDKPEARAKVFAWYTQFQEDRKADAQSDVKQRYLLIDLAE